MSRISQDLARQIAHKLVKKSDEVVTLLRKEYEEMVLVGYQNQTPAEVKKCFKSHPEWFYTKNTVKLHGHGFNWEWVNTGEYVICNKGSECFLELTDALATRLSKAKSKWEKAKNERDKLIKETEHALINLRTYKNIREAMPAAAPFLPPPITNAIMVNVDSLNKKLAHQPEVKKEKVVS